MILRLCYTEYIGVFRKQNKRGAWVVFWKIGNTEIAMDTAKMLEKLGHEIEYIDCTQREKL